MNEPTVLDLFSGIGGFSLGFERAGFKTIGFSEIDPYACAVLRKHWPDVRNYGDIRNVRNVRADVVTGGFPCQPFSLSGKRKGKADDRFLWPEMLRVVSESGAAWVLGENVPGIIGMELDRVLSDLENIGYTTWPIVIPACAVDAPHRRDRVWIVGHSMRAGSSPERNETRKQGGLRESSEVMAHSASQRINRECGNSTSKTGTRNESQQKPDSRSEDVLNSDHEGCRHISPLHAGQRQQSQGQRNHSTFASPSRWLPEPAVGRVAHGIPARVDRLKCLGNAIVPQIAYFFAQALRQFYP